MEPAPTVSHILKEGHLLSKQRRYGEAETCARRVIELDPRHAVAHNNLGFARHMQGDRQGARTLYEQALALAPDLSPARRNLLLLFAGDGDWQSCIPHVAKEIRYDGGKWVHNKRLAFMSQRDLTPAGALAAAAAALHRGSHLWPRCANYGGVAPPINEPERRVTNGTLEHDIAQFEYLISRHVLAEELTPILARYRALLSRRMESGQTEATPLSEDDAATVGDVYNRILYVRPTPRVTQALSRSWNRDEIEQGYLEHAQGVVIIDDFLTQEALSELRDFCLESTVWLANRYAHGRLGALFHSGFSCPLLLQIAEELRDAFPRVIGSHTLQQMWGFKNAPFQPGNTTTHADFAAVNINFWITPSDANLEPDAGGLIIYDVDAPRHWDFHTYNGSDHVIQPFLRRQNARSVTIPYRQNRAIIFNSDLFHCTDTVRFRPEYENRRINVTMLYGVRADDSKTLARPDPLTDPGHQAWKSAAFTRRGR